MRSFYCILALATAATAGGHGWGDCVKGRAVQGIIDNWVTLRTTDPTTAAYTSIASSTLADDITVEDETVSFFFFPELSGPYVTNRTTYIGAQTLAFQTSTYNIPKITPEIPVIHDCNTLVFRWLLSTSVSKTAPISTAKVGDAIVYKGTDILVLKPGTKLIQHVYTSGDYIKEIYQKGLKLCFQKNPLQNPVCADPPPAAPAR